MKNYNGISRIFYIRKINFITNGIKYNTEMDILYFIFFKVIHPDSDNLMSALFFFLFYIIFLYDFWNDELSKIFSKLKYVLLNFIKIQRLIRKNHLFFLYIYFHNCLISSCAYCSIYKHTKSIVHPSFKLKLAIMYYI